MSPGNSYFKDEVVKELLKKVIDNFGVTAILIADVPAISTYIALGYPENRAWRDKALPQGNNLRNRVQRAMNELGYSIEQVKVVDWKNEIEDNPEYKKKYEKVLNLYQTNLNFQRAVDDTTQEVLEYSDRPVADINSAIKIAVHYVLSELAFMEFAPQFLGIKKAVYIYHRSWPIYESYIDGTFDDEAKDYLGFEIVKI